uniref:Uncharacterized protein n=1 Tax=Hanusia phi TaxID=3032 RepID=A0A7S0E307_9CRYP
MISESGFVLLIFSENEWLKIFNNAISTLSDLIRVYTSERHLGFSSSLQQVLWQTNSVVLNVMQTVKSTMVKAAQGNEVSAPTCSSFHASPSCCTNLLHDPILLLLPARCWKEMRAEVFAMSGL